MKLSRPSKKQTIMLAVAGGLVAAFCLRGWVRNSVVPAYAESIYGKQLKATSQKTLLPLHEQLAPLGLHFTQSFGYAPGKACGLAYFHNFKETVNCNVYYAAYLLQPTAEQKNNWAAHSNDVEAWLAAHGWSKESAYSTRSFREVMHAEYASITYRKQEGTAICRVSLMWQGYESYASKPVLGASTVCAREVKFFGGNDTLMDGPLL